MIIIMINVVIIVLVIMMVIVITLLNSNNDTDNISNDNNNNNNGTLFIFCILSRKYFKVLRPIVSIKESDRLKCWVLYQKVFFTVISFRQRLI